MSVTFVEPRAETNPEWLDAVVDLHLRWFGDYAYAVPELVDNGTLPAVREGRVVHQILALVDDIPAGYLVVHTNLVRQVGVIHFLAVDEPFRSVQVGGTRLAQALVDHGMALTVVDAEEHGLEPFLGIVAEAEDDMVPAWQRWGYEQLPVEYREPHYGVRWPEHGEPTFFHRVLVAAPPPGLALDPAACARAGAAAFLLDHYRLPPDHPDVDWLRRG